MAVSALFSLGVKTMTASYAQLQTTGHNIANAHVEGYSRQTTELATSRGQFSGSGFFGKGVDVVTVTRAHNEFVAREADAAKTVATMDAARLTQLQSLEQVFRTGESGLGHAAGQFFNSMVDLASRPGDSSTRQVVLARAEEVANRFAHAAQQLDTLQRSATADLTSAVTQVNALGGNIAEVNGKIAALLGLGQPANDLLDERDRLVSKLNGIIQVSTIPAEDGSLSVFISGDQRLVLGTQAVKLQLLADETDPSRAGVGFTENGRDRQIDNHTLIGGTIAGLLRFQNDDLVAARNLVGRLAVAVAGASNEQQMLGLNLYPPAGSVPSEPFFRVGDPRSVPSRSNTRDASGNYLASVALTVTDASKVQASDYSLRADPAAGPGSYLITRLSDGVVRGIVSGDVVDGFRVDVGTPAPDISDRFLLQAVSRGANGMRLLLDDPRDVAAASPLVAPRCLRPPAP